MFIGATETRNPEFGDSEIHSVSHIARIVGTAIKTHRRSAGNTVPSSIHSYQIRAICDIETVNTIVAYIQDNLGKVVTIGGDDAIVHASPIVGEETGGYSITFDVEYIQ